MCDNDSRRRRQHNRLLRNDMNGLLTGIALEMRWWHVNAHGGRFAHGLVEWWRRFTERHRRIHDANSPRSHLLLLLLLLLFVRIVLQLLLGRFD